MRYIGNTSPLPELRKSDKVKEVKTNVFHYEEYATIRTQ